MFPKGTTPEGRRAGLRRGPQGWPCGAHVELRGTAGEAAAGAKRLQPLQPCGQGFQGGEPADRLSPRGTRPATPAPCSGGSRNRDGGTTSEAPGPRPAAAHPEKHSRLCKGDRSHHTPTRDGVPHLPRGVHREPNGHTIRPGRAGAGRAGPAPEAEVGTADFKRLQGQSKKSTR